MDAEETGRLSGLLGFVRRFLGFGLLTAVLAFPIVAQQSVERAQFDDRLGTFPVTVSLAHNGQSTLDTGLAGKLYWKRTGVAGFGASLRSTGPPEAGGTVSSYVSQEFLQANAAFVDDPAQIARVYGAELRDRVLGRLVTTELVAAAAGGLLGAVLVGRSRRRLGGEERRLRRTLRVGSFAVVMTASVAMAAALFARWDGNAPVGRTYAMPGIEELSFSSPQTREIAVQIEPFIQKNTERIAERSAAYRAAALASAETELPQYADSLGPRDGEVVVLTEADPQGSQVATRMRTALYPLLLEVIGEDSVVLRTIAGDVTSNGTVAEEDFVAREARALPDVPLVAVKGDHDSDDTVGQLKDNDVQTPDLEIVEAGGLRIAGAADPAFKALFGGLITNPSGVTEAELGEALREVVDEELDDTDPVSVVVHQPRAAAAYLGIGSMAQLDELVGNETTPVDDGIPDLPPGLVTVGHLHDASGPWVIWNTDGDEVTWTVVSQLGTSGGVEENPTFNRFSTPFSVPLKDVTIQLAYVDEESGLQTGYASVVVATSGQVTVEDRVDVGLPSDEPPDPVGPGASRPR
ncbi:metallophosphoesterase family protein [Nocardioides dilutus]